MKKFLLTLVGSVLILTNVLAQGWQANYGGVMLQGFYWDGYADAQWTYLEQQADDIAPYFSLIWVPNSGYCEERSNMGYMPMKYFDQNSSFGTESQLRSMIKSYKSKGTGFIADVVINHHNTEGWYTFPKETYNGKEYQLLPSDICANDDNGKTKAEATKNGVSLSANNDTGEDWDGCRDLDHKSQNVNTIVKAYLDFLLNDLGYAGVRYDMVKGYSAEFTGDYNSTAKINFSVGEYWDGNPTAVQKWIDGTKKDGVIQSAAFDFAFRYTCRDAAHGTTSSRKPGSKVTPNWGKLLNSTSAANATYNRYAVTFVENHDTEYRSSSEPLDPIVADTLALNAWLLGNPGTPCVFYKHWQAYKKEVKEMIEARKLVGIHNQSAFKNITAASQTTYCAREVTGTNGSMIVVVGTKCADYQAPAGYTEILSGYHYRYLVSSACNTKGWKETLARIAEEERSSGEFTPYKVTVYCKADFSPVYFYVWDHTGKELLGKWPGKQMTETVEVDGVKWFSQTFDITSKDYYFNIIFNQGEGKAQTANIMRLTTDKFFTATIKNGKVVYEDVTSQHTAAPDDDDSNRIVGGDISLLPQYEKLSSGYLDDKGNKINDLITWLTNYCGWNAFRVRLFVKPNRMTNDGQKVDPAVCQDLDYVKALGKRIKDAGAKFMLDFHYSDTWVDANHIQAPEACKGMTVDQKAEWIATYTKESLNALKAAGATPDYIQIGNEIMAGFMGIKVNSWDNTGSWSDYLKVLNAAAKATREACPNAKIIIHTDQPGNKQMCKNYYTQVKNAGIDYDVIGLSYYPFWHGTLDDLKAGLNTLKNSFPDKEIQIVETAYYMNEKGWPTSGINYDTRNKWKATEAGQYKMVKDLIATLADYSQVTGLMYWCPEDAGNGDTGSDWTTYKDLVQSGWTNRGLWNPERTSAGHKLITCAEGNVPMLMKSFLNTTALSSINAGEGMNGIAEMFDILGKPISTVPSRGMFIRNGKVVIVK